MAPSKNDTSSKGSKTLKPIFNQNQFTLKSYLQASPSPPKKQPIASTSKGKGKEIIEIIDSGSDGDKDGVTDQEQESPPRKKVKPSSGKTKAKAAAAQAITEQLWIDAYAPRDLDELVVNNKKVTEVQNWLTEALDNPKLAKYRRILVLSGPAGCGKTATLQVLSKEMDFEILEYKSGLEGGADTLVQQFPAFLNRAASAPMLDFGTTSPTPQSKGKGKAVAQKKKIILVEDLPNIFSSYPTKQAFRSALTAFANSSRSYAQGIPLVIIISEALIKTSNDSEWAVAEGGSSWQDNVSTRNIVPVEVLKGGKCLEIKFRPVAITFMTKALTANLNRIFTAKSSSTSLIQPSREAIDMVGRSANGDIRAAMNSLQFLVKEGKYNDAVTSIMADVAIKKGKKRKAGTGKLKESDIEHLTHLGSNRESSLFIFHALGKVLWSNRWGDKPEDDATDRRPKPVKPNKLPVHLSEYTRRLSKTDVNTLFADAPVDADMFMGYLHQNYAPFCDDIDQCANSMEYFSSSEAILRMENEKFSRHPLTSHYSFQTSVRGMLMSLPSPVPRNGQRMFKAESWERSRKQRENEENVADLVADLGRSLLLPLLQTIEAEDDDDFGEEAKPAITLPTRAALVNDLLPYLPLLHRSLIQSLPTHSGRMVRELAIFPPMQRTRGNIMDEDYVGEDEQGDVADSVFDAADLNEQQATDVVAEKLLYLEDDDIESCED